ncbi:PhoH family protein [Emcibacter nanhaiensis]|uniref:PhoH family protein n=1 Tax=Emcibacter nanhaiensis TaxID=1505037 RepID=A0A501PS52_9PROT|nr:PhoH family protein [Emcibacter nanhaiensis]TPD62794.1 PhoH family protein [Emcibacter nanhaiensis]
MGKKSRRMHNTSENQNIHSSNIRPLYRDGGWDPLGGEQERRDRKYVRKIKPQSDNQAQLIKAIEEHNVILSVGPAGTGKTYIAVAKAVEALEAGEVSKILLCRPAVEAGESLGYLPGAVDEKLAPYLRPLYDALADRMGLKNLKKYLHDGTIEIAPVAYMRGRTLNNAFVVVDEAQNCTYGQIKMLLTRLGWQSTMVMTGDPNQTDLLDGLSGLADISERLSTLEDVAVIRLADKDIVRHPLVAAMLRVI